MAFFTGKGDKGTTTLFDSKSGVRVSKASPLFECLGQLDELNATVGWCRAVCADNIGKNILLDVQHHLFTIQAEIAGAKKTVPLSSVTHLSALIKSIEHSLPEVKTFLIAGGTEYSARLDIARAISRRAERRLVMVHESGERNISEGSRAYANRLSSLFYALTRLENHRAGILEQPPVYKN